MITADLEKWTTVENAYRDVDIAESEYWGAYTNVASSAFCTWGAAVATITTAETGIGIAAGIAATIGSFLSYVESLNSLDSATMTLTKAQDAYFKAMEEYCDSLVESNC